MGMSVEHGDGADDAAAFHAFFERHYAELARLAHLLTGEADAADDLAADALVALWRHWDRVRGAEHPVAYARGVVANLARSRIRSAVRERRRVALFWSQRAERVTEQPDVPAVLDLREALQRLPFRKRACVVLRHAFDLSEKDTAEALGISVGTVKSQTSRGVAELERLLAPSGERPAAARGRDTAAAPAAVAVRGPAPGPSAGGPGAGAPAEGASAAGSPTTGSPTTACPAAARAVPEPALAPAPAPAAPPAPAPVRAADTAPDTGFPTGQAPAPSGDWEPAAGEGAEAAAGRQGRTGGSAAAGGSAPVAGADAEPGAATRILGSTNPTTRPRTHTGRGM
ncbi:putative RNA polymerase sigma factor [Actinacidiphila reveromycinica]|uniref:Putative RNA polymerase sigma factor n=1 Tax=Actinacidiphila reveromycinica TaxID=659352 RepID=A0A7U3VMG2_9ACTN|nr:putative RNA polymerase sigma factor [Streptomyces sp. SN-593]